MIRSEMKKYNMILEEQKNRKDEKQQAATRKNISIIIRKN